MKRRIGIMGGTFDPIHYGHLVLAEEVKEVLGLTEVIFIPAGQPPHKQNGPVTSAELRLEMVVAATKSNPSFSVSRMEIDEAGKSYTVKTLKKLRASFEADAELFFITGADTLLDLKNWYAADEVLALCTFVGATRPGYLPDLIVAEAQRLIKEKSARIELVPIPGLAISSTEIRQRVQQKKTIKYLVPEGVEDIIREAGLYE